MNKSSQYLAISIWMLLLAGAIGLSYQFGFKTWHADYLAVNGSWTTALAISNPYQDFLRKKYIDVLQNNTADVEIIKDGMQQLLSAINNHPNHYFFRIAYAEAAATFAGLDRQYLDEAEGQILQALKLSPDHPQNYYILAKIYLAKGEKEKVIPTLERAVAINPKNGLAHFFLAHYAFQLGYEEQSKREILIAQNLKWHPNNNQRARLMANYLALASHYQEAWNYYKLALEYNPDDRESLDLMEELNRVIKR